MTALEKLRGYVQNSKKIVFFGGAGVSTESGIPDFRSVDGLYSQQFDVPPETILSHDYFEKHPAEFFRFYREKMLVPEARPNKAHETLARWEREGRLLAVITQNVDGLHQAAGSRTVYELHGSAHRNTCTRCGQCYTMDRVLFSDGVPRCGCGGVIRPEIVLYGEGLEENTVDGAVTAITQADMLIVAGTSLTVYPAAGLIRYFDRTSGPLVLINRDDTPMDHLADLILRERVGEVLGAV